MDTPDSLLMRDAPRLAQTLQLETAEARLEARILLGHALGVNRAWLIAHAHDQIPEAALTVYGKLLERRLAGEPVAYLLGEKEFFGRSFQVTPAVLIPRPETELLVELALGKLPKRPARLLDLGTGSGCIAITLALARPDCAVVAVEQSDAALKIAAENAARLGAKVQFLKGSWFEALKPGSGVDRGGVIASEAKQSRMMDDGITSGSPRRSAPRDDETKVFDLIVSNPPYIAENDAHLAALAHEPQTALAAGADGLDDIRHIVQGARAHLAPGGWLLFEHGWDQGEACRELLEEAGFSQVRTEADLAGHGRVSLGCLP